MQVEIDETENFPYFAEPFKPDIAAAVAEPILKLWPAKCPGLIVLHSLELT